MRRLTGLDLNGWHDIAARDWMPTEPDLVLTSPVILDGGLASVAVQEISGQWTGGPQAALAPHGRGGGWGEIGAAERRVALADEFTRLLDGRGMKLPEVYASTVRALTYGAEDAVLAVPDRPGFDEVAQRSILNLFAESPCNHRLLWRPVALFLDALATDAIPSGALGQRFRLLIHADDGIEVQILQLRSDPDHANHIAPERDGYGTVTCPDLGLRALRDSAADMVFAGNPQINVEGVKQSRLPMALLCGKAEAGATEVLRRENGSWLEITAPMLHPEMVLGNIDPGHEEADDIPVTTTFLATPLADQFANMLMARLAGRWPGLARLPWDGIARGAWRAGRLIERGRPHYFDKLEPIALAVRRGDEPEFFDLVGQDHTVPANREYVSPPYRGLSWGRGKTEIEFYIVKGKDEVRHWQVQQEEGPPTDVAVELRLRQTPGQSWAKLFITSSEWEPLSRNPIFLDWVKITPTDINREEVLEILRLRPPTIPNRIIEQPHLQFWTENEWGHQGILTTLDRMEESGIVDLPGLLRQLMRSYRDVDTGIRHHPIGTDGTLPVELSQEDTIRFQVIIDEITNTVLAFTDQRPPANNQAIACLTWTFTRCSEPVQGKIVEALEAKILRQENPLLVPRGAITVLTQGMGRVVTGTPRMARVLLILGKLPVNNNTINALAMIFTRRAEAPAALTSELVSKFFEALATSLLKQVTRGSFKLIFRNTLSALAGMFRWREIEPYALLAARDPVASRVRDTLTKADHELSLLDWHVPQLVKNQENIALIIEYLDGQGDPNILHQIENVGE